MAVITPPRATVSPAIADSIAQGNEGRDMAVDGDILYTLGMSGEFNVIDKSDPENLVKLATLSDSRLQGAHGVALTADKTIAWVACLAGKRVTSVSVTNQSSPTILGTVTHATNLDLAADIQIDSGGVYAYVSVTNLNGIAVINISNPAAPTIAATLSDSASIAGPKGIKLVGTRLYIGNVGSGTQNGLTVIDVSTPTSPVVLGNGHEATFEAQAFAIDIVGDYAYTVNSGPANRLDVWEIANTTTHVPHNTPVWKAAVDYGAQDVLHLARPLNVVVNDGIAYVPCQDDVGVFAYCDVQDPLNPSYIGRLEQPVPGVGADAGSAELYHNYACAVPGDGYAYVCAHGVGRCTSIKLNRNYGEYADAGNGPRIA